MIQKRQIMGFIRNTLGLDPPSSPDDPTPENRFHPWDTSPSQDLRTRAAFIKAKAKCPVTGKEINYTCPLSGIPTHHSREAWEADENYHKNKVWEKLKKVNIYEHDLRSGRPFPEFDFPADQDSDRVLNFTNWDTFLYTRLFYSMDTEFQLAAVTKMLSYPITIGSVLHDFSPYRLKPRGPITLEGLKSLAALRYTLYPNEKGTIFQERPIRIFILGARSESLLPSHVWKQLGYLFPKSNFQIHFIGPECLYDQEKGQYTYNSGQLIRRVDSRMSFVYHTEYFHVLHESQDFFPYDPYLDVFFLFHPGLGAPEAMDQWEKTMPGLLDSKCGIFVTGLHESDNKRDWDWLMNKYEDKLDVLFERSPNKFGSLKWELNDFNPSEVFQTNQQIFGFRGKRYHAVHQGDA